MRKLAQTTAIVVSVVMLAGFAFPSQSRADAGTQRVLIEFAPGQKATLLKSLEQQGAQVHYEFDDLNVVAVTLPGKALNGIRDNPNVVRVEEDAPRYAAEQTVPYGVINVEARQVWDANGDGVIDANAPTGANRLVCIIDSGVDRDHEDFAGVNFVGGYPSGWDTDTCGHGTHVAGTIAAANNSAGVVGVSPGSVSLYILKVYGDNCSWTYSSTLIDAANHCRDAGANIVSMSLSGPYYSSYEDTNFQALYNQGILLVAAAGNGGGTAYGYPASYDSVVSVAAVDQNNVVASFSRQNDKVELAAPGVSVYSTYKDGGYATMSGTSMSTPHVSASAAVVWSSNPGKTNAEIRSILQQTALDLGAAGRDNAYGYGVIRSLHAIQAMAAPTAVDLTRFEALPDGASIRVEWETATEIDNLGFNLYRAESADGPRSQLNDTLIPGQMPGSPVGAAYQFVDESAQPGITYFYWLEDVDVYGTATDHGPVSAQLPGLRKLGTVRPRPAPAPTVEPVTK
jgi:subtilisin family serine protease